MEQPNLQNLPPAGREKFERIRSQLAVSDAGADPQLYQRIVDLHRAIAAGESWLARADKRDVAVQAEAAKQENEIKFMREEVARLTGIHDKAALERRALERLIANLKKYVSRHCSQPVAAWTGKLSGFKGGSPADQVERIRPQIDKIKADIAAIESAPISANEAISLWRTQVSQLASRGAPSFARIMSGGQMLFSPTLTIETLAWCCQDQILAAGERAIKAAAGNMDKATRENRIRELDAELLMLERQEEQAIENAPGLHRREDADARAILGLADDAPRPTV